MEGHAWALIALFGLCACVDVAPGPDWPAAMEAGSRVAVLIDPEGMRSLFRPDEDLSSALNVRPETELFLLDYACGDLETLGFETLLGNSLDTPTGPVRRPERLFRLVRGEASQFVEVPVEPEAPELARLGFEFRFPKGCKLFERIDTGLVLASTQGARSLTALKDGTALLLTGSPTRNGGTVYHFTSPTQYQSFELSAAHIPDAIAADDHGLIWLYNRFGRLWRGRVEDLSDPGERLETLPRGPPAHSCVDVPGRQRDVRMSLRAETSTLSELLVTDGSGTITRFARGVWTTLHDPVTSGRPELQCQVTPIDIAWRGPGEAMTINRSLGDGFWQIARIDIDTEGRASFEDDGLPSVFQGAERILELGARGIYAAGAQGLIARRRGETWSLLEVPAALTRDAPAFAAGPGGALLVGNEQESFVQLWPDAPGGPVSCTLKAEQGFVKDLTPLGPDHVLGMPGDTGTSRAVFAWTLREPTACELFPN